MNDDKRFGGKWTIEKLDIVFDYLCAYTTALKNTKFTKLYVDGFAGEGKILLKNGEFIDGSAAISLKIDTPFDRYIFIEKNENKVMKLKELKAMNCDKDILVLSGEANFNLQRIVSKTNWKSTRGVFFIDPFATQTKWDTLKCIANTQCADVWFLFPFYAINRILPKDVEQTAMFSDRLDKCFGTSDWKDYLYKQKETVQLSLFDGEQYESDYEKKDADSIIKYTINRLLTIFPYVSPNPRIFKNTKNSILFILFFMTANPNEKAKTLASRIAEHILGKKR